MPGRREDDARLVAIGSAPVAGRGQVSLHRWDGSTVGASLAEVPVDSPTWVQWTLEGRRLVVASEASPGRVLSFEVVEDDTGRPLLHPVADVPTGGSHPCHLAFTGDGSHVVVANYADGVVSLLEVEDGVPARLVDTVRLEGSGPDPARQEGSHPHHVAPLGARTISVVDLGSDRIQTFAVDDGRLREMARTDLPGGAGPRHLVRSSAPGPRAGSAPGMPATAYLTAELSGQVLRLAEEAPGRFAVVAAAAASGRPGADDVAHLALDEESDRLWVSNRGPDTVSTFDVAGGGLRLLDEVDVPAHPRQFTVHGGRVLVGGLRGDAVSVHEVRPDGTLGPGRSAPVPAPACIAVGPRRA